MKNVFFRKVMSLFTVFALVAMYGGYGTTQVFANEDVPVVETTTEETPVEVVEENQEEQVEEVVEEETVPETEETTTEEQGGEVLGEETKELPVVEEQRVQTVVEEGACSVITTTIVSDTSNIVQETGNPAVKAWEHPNWADISGADWIWESYQVANPLVFRTVDFTKEFTIDGTVTEATLEIAADNYFTFDLNGNEVLSRTESDDTSGSVGYNFQSTYSADAMGMITSGENTIDLEVTNRASSMNSVTLNPAGVVYKLTVVSEDCGDEEETATVHATKIVCDSEADLPNWGAGNVVGSINSATASLFLDEHEESCHEEDWTFEWSLDGVGNPGDNGQMGGEGWNAFTDTTDIPTGRIWFREQMQDGYIFFTGANTTETVSAEIYCGSDVLNYDNWEYIDAVDGGEYYCVAFNAPVEVPYVCDPEINLIENGSFENPDISTGTYEIVKDLNEDVTSVLAWLVAWTTPEDGGRLGLEVQDHVAGNPAVGAGDQFAELDGDHPTAISQDVETVAGEPYTLTFMYSPRQGRNAADNMIEVQKDGAVLGDVLAADGTANSDTAWATYTRTFIADDSSTTISFVDTGTDTSFGGYLDEVRLSCGTPVVDDEESTITVTKIVVGNDAFDSSDFPLYVNETSVVSGIASEFEPGTYTVYESSNADFIPTFSGACVADESNESRIALIEDFQAKKTALENAIAASPEDVEGNQIKTDMIFDINEKIVALQNSLSATIDLSEGEDAECVITNTYTPVVVDDFPQCSDGEDNDEDGLSDELDPGCHTDGDPTDEDEVDSYDPEDDDETNTTEEVVYACSDDADNDEDGLTDANDPGCHSDGDATDEDDTYVPTDNDETNDTSSNTNGGGGSSGSRGGGGSVLGEVLGASTSCGIYLNEYIIKGSTKNNPAEIMKLQTFLNNYMNTGLTVSGVYDAATIAALNAFQLKEWLLVLRPWGITAPTGNTYLTTQLRINNIMCPELNLSVFPPLHTIPAAMKL